MLRLTLGNRVTPNRGMNANSRKVASEVLLWLSLAALASAAAFAEARGATALRASTLTGRFAVSIILVSWVYADGQSRGKSLCYDFDTFVFFAWPLVVPYYLFQTRGARALLTMLYFGCLCVAAGVFGLGVYGLLWILNR